MHKKTIFIFVSLTIIGIALWWAVRFVLAKRNHPPVTTKADPGTLFDADAWFAAVARVKADRGGEGAGAIVIPTELRHYTDRHWFLATQVAEVTKYNVHSCRDYVDLAAMIGRGELIGVPAVTNTYVLYGVGARADESFFTRYANDKVIDLYDEAELKEAYRQIDEQRLALESEMAASRPKAQSLHRNSHSPVITTLRKRKVTGTVAGQLQALAEQKALLDEFYGQPDRRQQLLAEYDMLKKLAASFNGRGFDLENPSDRQALKINMLSVLRPEALKVLEEIAAAYKNRFDRPLPVSSLIRPEQYQHSLHRVNRNAVLIETPPHSTGLAFDIDYRYMSAAEQTFLMAYLANLKNAGRIEVLRERNSNYHVFAFINGMRPSDDLITASLEKVNADDPTADQQTAKPESSKKTQSKVGRSSARTKRRFR